MVMRRDCMHSGLEGPSICNVNDLCTLWLPCCLVRRAAKISAQPAATLILVLVSCRYLVSAVIPRDRPLSDWRLAA